VTAFFYPLLLFLHVFSVTLTIGPFFVLFPVAKRLRTAEMAELPAYLYTFQFSVRLVKHAGHVLVVTGILLALVGDWPWTTPWLLLTIILLVGSIIFLARAFTPTLRRFREDNPDRIALGNKLYRALWIYIALLLFMLMLMVTKPLLWA